jgi:hypothetical protein
MASLYEQVIKLVPTKGGGAEAVAAKDVVSTLIGFCLAAFGGSSTSHALQYSTHQNNSRS